MDPEDEGNPFKTAVRGLEEELAVTVPTSSVYLTTLIFKFDTHEWGMMGFIDLREPQNENLTADALKDRHHAAKDRFENLSLELVEFTLPAMAQFVRTNFQERMASSTIVCAVHIMQHFFGVRPVEEALQ
jgi:hypothetical protein